MTVIGIDLGTTNTCVSVYRNGRFEVFENDLGYRTTPSVVAFTDEGFIVGNEAKRHTIDPRNTVFDTKRLIGRKYFDECVQADIKNWPFVIQNLNGKAIIHVSYLKNEKRLIPEEISAIILRRMKEIAEEKLGETITRAVITVPAYFNDSQRQSTKDAAVIAGLTVMRLINEPTAAAIAFALNKKDTAKSNILVYDLGGGTFDVSVLSVDNGNIEVKAINGDTHLGGCDFDNRVLEYFLDEIKRNFKKDLMEAKYTKSLTRLRQACEAVKISLSTKNRAQVAIEIDSLFDGTDFRSKISRAKFEHICEDLMTKTLTMVENVLNDANLKKEDIDDILLVGGSTRILKIQNLVQEFFGGKTLNKSVNPEEAVACGAAVQAALLDGEVDEAIAAIKLREVTPLSYGVQVSGELMSVIIPRNTPYPTKRTKTYQTIADNQLHVSVKVYQGEKKMVKDNFFLGTFKISGLLPQRKGQVYLDETMEIDENGILVVTAVERSTGVTAKLIITNSMESISQERVEQLKTEAEIMRTQDLEYKEKIFAINELESYILDLKHIETLTEKAKSYVKHVLEESSQWMANYPNATKEMIDIKLSILKLEHKLIAALCKATNTSCNS